MSSLFVRVGAPVMNMNLTNNMSKPSAVLYHYPCPDGAFAALAAHLYFSATSSPVRFFPNTVYSPLRSDDLYLQEFGDVYLLDFVGPPGFVQEISSNVGRLVVLDHHKTALETLGGEFLLGENVTKVIDMKRSGATIAFDYFKEKLMRSPSSVSGDGDGVCISKHAAVLQDFDRVRRVFEYIEDGDLWRWSLQNSKAFSSGLKDLNLEFDVQSNPSLFDQLLSLDLDSVINQGLLSLSHKQMLIDGVLSRSYEIALGGGSHGHCLAVDADAVSELRSELGHQLATKSHNLKLRGIGAVVYRVSELQNDQLLKISLRSIENEDTTPISETELIQSYTHQEQKFGGGGHRNASSFMLSTSEFEQWKL